MGSAPNASLGRTDIAVKLLFTPFNSYVRRAHSKLTSSGDNTHIVRSTLTTYYHIKLSHYEVLVHPFGVGWGKFISILVLAFACLML